MNREASGWTLIEARLTDASERRLVYLRTAAASSNAAQMIPLPVLPNGRIHELVSFTALSLAGAYLSWPNGELVKPASMTIRRIGRSEQMWRMANRVFDTIVRLPTAERIAQGLSVWRILSDLPSAYRIATRYRFSVDYGWWVEQFDQFNSKSEVEARNDIATFPQAPHFRLLVSVDGASRDQISATVAALNAQIYRNFSCALIALNDSDDRQPTPNGRSPDDAFQAVDYHELDDWLMKLNASLAVLAKGDWVLLLRSGAILENCALYWIARQIVHGSVAIIYSDDDAIDARGLRHAPRFKPDWSLTHFRETNFLGDIVALRGDVVAAAGGISATCCRHGNYDLVLRTLDALGDRGEASVAHIPRILLHQMPIAGGGVAVEERETASIAAVRSHLKRRGIDADVSASRATCRAVRYALPDQQPLVSIIVPTRDARSLLERCVESVRKKTTYHEYELVIVDNQSANPGALEYLREIEVLPRLRVLHYDQSFNYSAINNYAVSETKGEVICLLNNDTEVISADWLAEMVGHLLQPGVGVVGAKLYYPDGRVQHAGDTVGPGGCANHLHSFIEHDDPGYCNRAAVAQELSAVTAACLVTWRDLYLRLGGLDAKHLKIAFNDVDYCLRVRQSGHKVVWTPHAELYHHESVSRGKDTSWRQKLRAEKEVAVMRRRWRHVMQNDPFYNPNLSYMRADFSLSHVPRVSKLWQER